ncbi:MAG: ribonuclease [Sphingosinicella sp.]
MAEWLYEQGIGENRAILVEDDEILEAAIERPAAQRAGAVLPARLTHILVAGRRGIASIEGGEEALVEPLQAGLCEGASFRVEIVREPIDEAGHRKLALARACEAAPRPGPDLAERTGPHVQLRPDEPDRFEQAGWSELLEQAASGTIPFAGGTLRMSLTPAMTLFDVDGPLDPELLAIAGAEAAARTIRRFGLGGSIGIDLPTLPRGPARKAAAATFDAILPAPFERSAVNGFGFLQVILRRERASIP